MKTLDLELIAIITVMLSPVIVLVGGMIFKALAINYVGVLFVGVAVLFCVTLIVAMFIDCSK